MSRKLLEIISVDSVVVDLLPIRFSTLDKTLEKKNGSLMGQCISYL
jgi:hypothetical protein